MSLRASESALERSRARSSSQGLGASVGRRAGWHPGCASGATASARPSAKAARGSVPARSGSARRCARRARSAGYALGREPRGYKRPDDRILDGVCERIARSWVDASEVEVQVQAGDVILRGRVPSKEQKYVIEDIAENDDDRQGWR
jgi:osmotically-inducible protein OsmY